MNTVSFKIQSAHMKNYGVISDFSCNVFSNVNLFIGENATGKTFILKALYSAIRAMEEHKRGDDIRQMGEILPEKLRWSFQVEKLGDLVNRSADGPLVFQAGTSVGKFEYQFSEKARTDINNCPNISKEGNSIFIPAKEVLSLFSVILKSREVDKAFGFDDTYYDLVKALQISPAKGRKYDIFAKARKDLKTVIGGKIDYNAENGKWSFKNESNQKFSIGATAEGIKKISIMDRLLANGYLGKDSVLFIDELESALHPKAICDFLDMLVDISHTMGIQMFISTHSYFVIKKLCLLAGKYPNEITCISLSKDKEPQISNLSEGMPENSIIQASIDLYEEEIAEAFK